MMPDFCVTEHRVARKSHRCHECRGDIAPGHVYEVVSGRWEGRISRFKTCLRCEQARDFYVHDLDSRSFRELEEGEFAFSCLFTDLHEVMLELEGGLRFAAGRHLVGIRKRHKKGVL